MPSRNSRALIIFSAIVLLMLLFVAAAPWIIRSHGYGIFIPAVASSGLLTIVAASLAGRIGERSWLVIASPSRTRPLAAGQAAQKGGDVADH